MKTIKLTKGYVAIVDDEDYDRLAEHKWSALEIRRSDGSVRVVYAVRALTQNGKQRSILMHRVIMGATSGDLVDHINCDSLDNTRKNLRFCTHTQNACNSRRQVSNSSGYKGVSWHSRDKRWQSFINIDGKTTHLGNFKSPLAAARAYDKAAMKHHGEFARLNGV